MAAPMGKLRGAGGLALQVSARITRKVCEGLRENRQREHCQQAEKTPSSCP